MNTTQLDLLQRDWIDSSAPVVIERFKGREFTTDDLHGAIPEPHHPNMFGALMAGLKRRGLISRIGYRPSGRTEANGRVVAVWAVL